MSEIEMSRREFADYFDQHTRTLKALIAERDAQIERFRALLVRAADALGIMTQMLLISDVPLEWEENKRKQNMALIAELRKAAE